MTVTLGRRVADVEDMELAGDYCGPFRELEGPDLTPSGRTAVWLLAPDGSPARLASPPWEFTEQADGTLEIATPIRAAVAR